METTASPTALQSATDDFLVRMSALCDRLYRTAIERGATDEQALRAVKLTLIDFMKERSAE